MGQLSELHGRLLRLKLDARTALAEAGDDDERRPPPVTLESKVLADATEHLWRVLDGLYGKANFNPNQPRVPAGSSEGGQWTDGGGSGGRLQTGRSSSNEPPKEPISRTSDGHIRVTIQPPPDIGRNNGPPLEDPSQLPPELPPSRKTRLVIAKKAAVWVAKAIARGVPYTRAAMLIFKVARWLFHERHNIRSFVDAPKTMSELQDAVGTPRKGYEIHHIAEQTSALRDGYAPALVHGRDNLVRIPTWKHHLINAWYGRPNPEFGGRSPREYLRGKSWEESVRVGKRALVKYEVLKR